MDFSIGGQQPVLVDGKLITFKVCDPATGLFHHQVTGGAIPGFQFMFIESIEPACSHPTKIDSSRTQSPYRNAFADETFKNFQWSIFHIDIRIRKNGDETGFQYFSLFAYMNACIIESGATTFFCKK